MRPVKSILCHSEERSDEESLSLDEERSLAALGMTKGLERSLAEPVLSEAKGSG